MLALYGVKLGNFDRCVVRGFEGLRERGIDILQDGIFVRARDADGGVAARIDGRILYYDFPCAFGAEFRTGGFARFTRHRLVPAGLT
jgi:hypothetical protein